MTRLVIKNNYARGYVTSLVENEELAVGITQGNTC